VQSGWSPPSARPSIGCRCGGAAELLLHARPRSRSPAASRTPACLCSWASAGAALRERCILHPDPLRLPPTPRPQAHHRGGDRRSRPRSCGCPAAARPAPHQLGPQHQHQRRGRWAPGPSSPPSPSCALEAAPKARRGAGRRRGGRGSLGTPPSALLPLPPLRRPPSLGPGSETCILGQAAWGGGPAEASPHQPPNPGAGRQLLELSSPTARISRLCLHAGAYSPFNGSIKGMPEQPLQLLQRLVQLQRTLVDQLRCGGSWRHAQGATCCAAAASSGPASSLRRARPQGLQPWDGAWQRELETSRASLLGTGCSQLTLHPARCAPPPPAAAPARPSRPCPPAHPLPPGREKCLSEGQSGQGGHAGYSSLSQAPEEWSVERERPCSGERLLLMFDRWGP
jgi:hypothetical protein